MKRYRVTVPYYAKVYVEVDADDKREARKRALAEAESRVNDVVVIRYDDFEIGADIDSIDTWDCEEVEP